MSGVVCPWCGDEEPSDWHLRINHWVRLPGDDDGYDWCAAHGMCIAMNLTQNHVTHAGDLVRRGNAACRVDLARAIARAEEVWPADRQAWLKTWRPLLRELEAPVHAEVAFDRDDVGLFA